MHAQHAGYSLQGGYFASVEGACVCCRHGCLVSPHDSVQFIYAALHFALGGCIECMFPSNSKTPLILWKRSQQSSEGWLVQDPEPHWRVPQSLGSVCS